MCLYTRYIRNGRYVANKKNGGVVPAIPDYRVMATPIKCGQCMECHKQKRNEWRVRISEEIKSDIRGYFVTLTFSDENIKKLAQIEDLKNLAGYKLDNAIATIAVRRWYERHRKKYKKTIKHWLVTEIGGNHTERIHLHGIVWTDLSPKEIEEFWGYGTTRDGRYRAGDRKQSYLNERTVNYITKYLTKRDLKHKHYKSIILTSNGIGKNYINTYNAILAKYVEGRTQEAYISRGGHQIQMPKYLRNKIYTDEEREKLWIEKLDSGYRYIGGRKININHEDELYKKYLTEAQKENKRRGYGNGDFNWNEAEKEEQRRILKQKENWGTMEMKWDEREPAFTNGYAYGE